MKYRMSSPHTETNNTFYVLLQCAEDDLKAAFKNFGNVLSASIPKDSRE